MLSKIPVLRLFYKNTGQISNTLISSFKYMYSMQYLVCVMFYHFYDLEDFISFAIIMQYIKDIISSLHVHYIVAHIQFPFILCKQLSHVYNINLLYKSKLSHQPFSHFQAQSRQGVDSVFNLCGISRKTQIYAAQIYECVCSG